jgi:hypothetical protein
MRTTIPDRSLLVRGGSVVDCTGREVVRADVRVRPSNSGRLTRKEGGYRYIIVDGGVVQENDIMTAERSGRMLSRTT